MRIISVWSSAAGTMVAPPYVTLKVKPLCMVKVNQARSLALPDDQRMREEMVPSNLGPSSSQQFEVGVVSTAPDGNAVFPRFPPRFLPRLRQYERVIVPCLGMEYSIAEVVVGGFFTGYELGTGLGYSVLDLLFLVPLTIHGIIGILQAWKASGSPTIDPS